MPKQGPRKINTVIDAGVERLLANAVEHGFDLTTLSKEARNELGSIVEGMGWQAAIQTQVAPMVIEKQLDEWAQDLKRFSDKNLADAHFSDRDVQEFVDSIHEQMKGLKKHLPSAMRERIAAEVKAEWKAGLIADPYKPSDSALQRLKSKKDGHER